MSFVFLTRMPISGEIKLVESMPFGEHAGCANFREIEFKNDKLPFKLKKEKNEKGGWYSMVTEECHGGRLTVRYFNEEESIKIDNQK